MKSSGSSSEASPRSTRSGDPLAAGEADPRRRRRRWFRVIALGVPLVNVVLLELLLRVLGYGYATSFFLRSPGSGGPVLVDNQQFTRRYFPSGLERTPRPARLPLEKPAGALRVFVLGESAAMGDPEPAFGFARILELLLREALPGRRIEVVNVAVTAINSHVIRDIARDCAPAGGDFWVVYMGNNEVVGPFGAGTVFGDQVPPLGMIRANLALKRLRLGQLVDAVRQRWGRKEGAPSSWEGMEMFLQQQVAAGDPRMPRVYQHFQANLDDIVRSGAEAGARVVLATVASNLKDSPPFGSLHRPGLGAGELAEWQRHFDAGAALEEAGQFAAALTNFQAAARIDGEFALLTFRLGRCLLALGERGSAEEQLRRARDLDTLRFRADTRINDLIRAAARRPGVLLVDSVALLATNSPQGVPGSEFFHEHVHYQFAGNHLLARAFAAEILQTIGPGSAATNRPADWRLNEAECGRRLAWTGYERLKVAEEMGRRLALPPFSTQIGQASRLAAWRREIHELASAREESRFVPQSEEYRLAIARSPDDPTLREHYATFLHTQGHPAEAEEQWRKLAQLLPHSEHAFYGLASALDALGRAAEAEAAFRAALQRRPGAVEALNGLGLALAGQGRTADAAAEYRRALRRKPDFAEARVNLGQLLARQGQSDEAEAEYREVLRTQSNNVPARVNLGKLLAERGRPAEAMQLYREAAGIDPTSVAARYNLGNALLNQGDRAAAREQYREAVRLDPSLAEAHYNLGLCAAQLGDAEEALRHLGTAARLRPAMAEARLNFGVALARARRFDEAAREFAETLRLDPGNGQARKFLEQATTLRGRGR